jgi:hypothetical protein
MIPLIFVLELTLTLTLTRQTAAPALADGVIVGRAVCRGSTWLLTDRRLLTRWSGFDAAATRVSITGLRSDDRPWGLACLDDGSVWTLGSPRALVRLDDVGRAAERVELPLPRIALFGAGDRVLFQQFPLVAGAAALAVAAARHPSTSRPWTGLVSRGESSRELELTRNLATCGIGFAGRMPCWFADAHQVSISDGISDRVIDLSTLFASVADRDATIHDVALVPQGEWILVGGRRPASRQRTGVRLFYRSSNNGVTGALDLLPGARVILSADERRCVLFDSDDRVVEVTVRP